jgi:hypothetical protein
MRKLMLLLAALGVAGLAAIPAFGATTKNGVTGTVTPTKGGTAAKVVGHKLFTQVTTVNDDKSQPPPVQTTVLTYGKEFDFNGKFFPTCSKATLDNVGPTKCPKGSKVGTGSSDAQIGDTVPEGTKNIPVTAFNGPADKKGNRTIELYVGAPLQKSIEGVQTGGKGKPKVITFTVPDEAMQTVAGLFSSIVRFGATLQANVKKSGKTIPYIQTSGCPSGGIPLTAKFIYARADYKWDQAGTGLSDPARTTAWQSRPDLHPKTPFGTAATKIKCTK